MAARRFAVAVMLGLGLLSAATPVGASGNSNPRVFPPTSHPYGGSYPEWTAAWWDFMFSFPIHNPPNSGPVYNPLFDQTGSQCAVGQSGHVWYLAGVFNASGTADRTCTQPVPHGSAFFLPVVNSFSSDTSNPGPTCGTNGSVDDLRDQMEPAVAGATNLHVTVDGVALTSLRTYRFKSPVFRFNLPPQDNVFQSLGCDVAGLQGPAVSDGYWLMLHPLTPGSHTIEFGGTIPANNNFTTDVTYHLTAN